jgi:phage/plasmid primase-like uncharacterized protein
MRLVNEFREAMHAAGLRAPDEIIADGQLHRFSSNGELGDDAGWYVFHDDGIPAGSFGCWRLGVSQKWRADIERDLTLIEKEALREKEEADQQKRSAEQERRQRRAAEKALVLWKTGKPAQSDHPYLIRKKVHPVGTLRELGETEGAAILGYRPRSGDEYLTGRILVAPIKVGEGMSSAELIDENGRKSAIAGGAKASGYWAAQPLPPGDGTGLTLLIGEGIATVLSAQQATGYAAIAALSCGNLEPVAKEIRARYPAAKIVVLADLGNGQADAVKAAAAACGLIAVPDLASDLPDGTTDFNDLACVKGLEAVAEAIADAKAPQELGSLDVSHDIDGEQTSRTQVAALIEFAQARAELFHDPDRNVYARDRVTLETRRLDGQEFRDWLAASYYRATGKAPREQTLREALSTMRGIGLYGGERHEVHVRVAKCQDAYFLDLGEPGQTRAVRIASGNWEVVCDPPARFVRPQTMRPLPEPRRGGHIDLLWQLANIPPEAQLLVLTWLAECLRPDTPYPVLELIGEQGSAKSTTQDVLRKLIDPNACNLRGAPKTVDDIFVGAGSNWLTSFENISHLSPAMQDALCVLATGGGHAKRKLYTDADESVISVKRPVVLNGIAAAVTAQDLIDRTISVELPVITARAEVTELHKTFEEHQGRLLGALLDIVATALARLPLIYLAPAERPRLAEFARFGMAIAEVLGQSGAMFITQFRENREESIGRTIDANPVASAVLSWIGQNPDGATDTASGFMTRMEPFKPARVDSWPWSPKGFADSLRRAAPALRQMGVECRRLQKTGGVIRWVIRPANAAPEPGPERPDRPDQNQDIKTSRTSDRQVSAWPSTPGANGRADDRVEIEF